MKEVLLGFDSREKLLTGVNTVANSVKVTLGPKGRNVIIDVDDNGVPIITKDGVSVAQAINLPDNFENMGAKLIKQVANQADVAAGDGTTTSTVLAQSIINAGCRAVATGHNPMDIKRGIDIAANAAIELLKENAVACDTDDMIANVGRISANGDASIGKLLADVLSQVGVDGVITVEAGKGLEDSVDIVDGLKFDNGYLASYFVNNPKTLSCDFGKTLVVCVDGEVSQAKDAIEMMEAALAQECALLVIAREVSGAALASLVSNVQAGSVKACAVKAPMFGEETTEQLDDILALVGESGIVESVSIGKNSCTIVGGTGDVTERVANIKEWLTEATGLQKSNLEIRLGKLSGGVAVIKVGGTTDVDMRERYDRMIDAMSATRAAAKEGIVSGGGEALLRCSLGLSHLKSDNFSIQHGIDIMLESLLAPIKQIAANAGVSGDVVVNNLSQESYDGYNASTDTYENMIEAGIIDPVKVTRCAVQFSSSIAGLMITTESMITSLPKPPKQVMDFGDYTIN